jgi:hypothetical protein
MTDTKKSFCDEPPLVTTNVFKNHTIPLKIWVRVSTSQRLKPIYWRDYAPTGEGVFLCAIYAYLSTKQSLHISGGYKMPRF